MRFQVKQAFFTDLMQMDAEGLKGATMIQTLPSAPSYRPIKVLVQLEGGDPNTSHTAKIALKTPDGRVGTQGPDPFRFSATGEATLIFQFHRFPLKTLGVASAHVRFDGEPTSTQVCSVSIVPPSAAAKTH